MIKKEGDFDKLERDELQDKIENTVYKIGKQLFEENFLKLKEYLDAKLSDFKKDDELHKSKCMAYNMWDKETCGDFYRTRDAINKHIELHKQKEKDADKLEEKKRVNKRLYYMLIFPPVVGVCIKGLYDFLFWLFHRV